MQGKLARASAAVLLAALGVFIAPALSKTTSTLSPGSSDDLALKKAQLLASHGEPALALSTLRSHRFDRAADVTRLTASLLAELGQPARAESLLSASPSDKADPVRDQIVRARLLLDANRYPATLDALASIDTVTASPYVAYRDLVAARALMGERKPEPALGRLERTRARAPEAIRDEMDALRIDLLRALGRSKEALAAAEAAAETGRDPGANRKLLAIRFDLARDSGDPELAAAAARELFRNHRRSDESRNCALVLASSRDASRIDTELLMSCAQTLQIAGKAEACRSVLRHLDARDLDTAENEELRLLWGEYHYLRADYSRAIALARPSYADPALQRRSMLLMARSYRRVGRTADAATTYQAYARAFPNDGMAAEALYTAASLYEQLKREDDRTRVLDQLRHAYPSTFHGWAASMARAKALDASGDHADAAEIFDQWLTRSQRTDEAALFYSSRQKKSAGDESGSASLMAELRAVNPYSFYGSPGAVDPAARAQSAAAAKSLNNWLTDASAKRDVAFDRVQKLVAGKSKSRTATDASLALERGRFFLAAGIRDWAEQELDVARRRTTDAGESLALARLFDDHAMPWRSVRLYERTRAAIPWRDRAETADDFRYLTHPVPYPAQVITAAQREGIAPYVLYGMMREESCFDHDIVSRAGAVGLMQLMPETARRVAKRLDLAPGAGDRLGDPVVNVSIGSWYAADLLRAGDGSVVWMLAAYNAGPAAANRWIEPGVEGDAAIDAVDSIDYKETRGYVKRVVESCNVYHSLYFDGGSAPAGEQR
jgi:soluble lytic murein transglycosylase